jgi:hypothetical protein
MTDKIKLARGLSLPAEAMLQRFAILAMSGAGKSNVAAVMCEQMYGKVPWVVIDPKGDWWGLRSSKTGKSAGLDVPIFGGLHADIPLYEDGGAVMADAVAHELTHSIIDVSEFETKAAMLRFLTDFAERIYRVNKTPIVVVLEEADEFIPQKTNSPAEAKSVGVWSRVQKRGRTRGIFTVLVAQRIAELAKAVLNQADTVIALRATAKLDRDAIKGWIEYAAAAREILDSLPTLDDGHGWFASPQKLKRTELVHFDQRHTFDSGSTPSLGDARETVKLASIDLSAMEERMKETIERARADDPDLLRKQIRELQVSLANQVEANEALKLDVEKALNSREREPVDMPVPVLDEDTHAEVTLAVDDLRNLVRPLPELVSTLVAVSENVGAHLTKAETLLDGSGELPPGAPTGSPPSPPQGGAPRPRPPAPPRRDTSGEATTDLQPSEQKLLDAVMWWYQLGQHAPTKQMVAIVGGYSAGKKIGGRLGNLFGALRTKGLIDYPGPGSVALTPDGHATAQPPGFEATTAAIQAAVMSHLDPSEARLLQAVIDHYPSPVDKREAAAEAGYSVGDKIGGRVGNLFGKLRSLGFIDYPTPGEAVAMPVLFLEAR